jgi:WD40 repeat protein
MKPPSLNSYQFDLHWRGTLGEQVQAIAWSPQGKTLAASSASGEVMLWQSSGDQLTLQAGNGQSVDCIAFSQSGQFLAVGGQDGRVKIWRASREYELIAIRENAPTWVDKLAWSPTSNHLAFSLGRYVQVWDADIGDIAATLNFDTSSVLGLDWRPDGQYLAICGYQGTKIWHSQDWNDDPYVLDVPSASLVLAWSPDGEYLASGNMDRTVTVLEWNTPYYPWLMGGYPGKIRQLAWSEAKTKLGAPLLASSSVEGIVVWSKASDDNLGWERQVLNRHTEMVQAIAFEPNSFLLASAANDGLVCLWHQAKRLAQTLDGAPNGFSCLAWHPQGQQLAAGGQNGELLIWSKMKRGQGFGRR